MTCLVSSGMLNHNWIIEGFLSLLFVIKYVIQHHNFNVNVSGVAVEYPCCLNSWSLHRRRTWRITRSLKIQMLTVSRLVIKPVTVLRCLVNWQMRTSFSYTLISRHTSMPFDHIRFVYCNFSFVSFIIHMFCFWSCCKLCYATFISHWVLGYVACAVSGSSEALLGEMRTKSIFWFHTF